MSTTSFSPAASTIRFGYANWAATNTLPRDRTQSQRLHEPTYRVDTIDPMTGDDIGDVSGHPSLVDGNLTIYFATEATRKAYVDMPFDRPNRRLPFAPGNEDDRGG